MHVKVVFKYLKSLAWAQRTYTRYQPNPAINTHNVNTSLRHYTVHNKKKLITFFIHFHRLVMWIQREWKKERNGKKWVWKIVDAHTSNRKTKKQVHDMLSRYIKRHEMCFSSFRFIEFCGASIHVVAAAHRPENESLRYTGKERVEHWKNKIK